MADLAGAAHREFFAVRTVAETLAGFRPARRTATETVTLEDAHRRVPAEAVRAPHDLPGFARSTVDGYAVRAADTYGASEGLPSYLDVGGAVAMGRAPSVSVVPGTAVAMPTGGVIPDGADAVVMVEHTQEAMAGTIEVVRPVAPGDGLVRADEDARAGAEVLPAGRALRAQDLGLLAAAGVTAGAGRAPARGGVGAARRWGAARGRGWRSCRRATRSSRRRRLRSRRARCATRARWRSRRSCATRA